MGSEGQSRDPLVDKLLGGKYLVQSLVARGGMGRVYRGVQQPLNRPIAIKVLDFHALDPERNEQVGKRFLLEASVCARLTHPNILTVHDYGTIEEAKGVFIIMEFLEGSSLRALLREERALPVERTIHIARQICAALIEAHDAGLVHRDLKPGNVVLVRRGPDPDFVKVVDFGLVKQVAAGDDSAEVLTAEGLFLGTPRYMAPEQITGSPVDARTDIYSLGIMLYECLAGRPPFRSSTRGELPVDLFQAHLKKRPRPLSAHELSRGVPPEVEAIVMRCLEKKPERRFPSMRDLLAALDQASRTVDEAPSRAGEIAALREQARLAETIPEAGPSDGVTASTIRMPPRALAPARGPRLVAASLAVVLVPGAAALSAWLLLGSGRDEAPLVTLERTPPVERPAERELTLTLTSAPPGATVLLDGERLGETPLLLTLPRASLPEGLLSLTFELESYAPVTKAVAAPEEGVALALHAALERVAPARRPVKDDRKPRPRRPPTQRPALDIKVDR
jgi:eukaryotic-like serine/threonine-protein kinase